MQLDLLPDPIGADCAQRCPVCQGRCLGGPARYLDLHLCGNQHQWALRRWPPDPLS